LIYSDVPVSLLSLFSKDKSFALPIIGSPLLNKCGLHLFRIRLADILLKLRRFQVAGFSKSKQYQQFKRDGIIAIDKFLSNEDFTNLVAEVKNTMAYADNQTPIKGYGEEGFGQKHNHDWGFDRYDGGTLNRFYSIEDKHIHTQKFLNDKRLIDLTSRYAGTYHDKNKYDLYKLHHGDESDNADSQKLIHRDTFHSAVKLWYFLEDVTEEQGPFHYMPGSHLMTKKRLAWEKNRSVQASLDNKGGAFRISAEELEQVYDGNLQGYPVKANTLVIADIRGFHCRGLGTESTSRLSIYANIRPSPFLPAYNASSLKKIGSQFKNLFGKSN